MNGKVNGMYSSRTSKHTIEDAAKFVEKYLTEEDSAEGYSLSQIHFIETIPGQGESCGGCTLGDGRDCSTPYHYKDIFGVECQKKGEDGNPLYRYSKACMGWQTDSDCVNSFGDYYTISHDKSETPERENFAVFITKRLARRIKNDEFFEILAQVRPEWARKIRQAEKVDLVIDGQKITQAERPYAVEHYYYYDVSERDTKETVLAHAGSLTDDELLKVIQDLRPDWAIKLAFANRVRIVELD